MEYQVTHLGQVTPATRDHRHADPAHPAKPALPRPGPVRIRYTGNRDIPKKESGSAAITVRKPELKLDMSNEQIVLSVPGSPATD